MRRLSMCGIALALSVLLPRVAAAGGGEFPADGARNLGRGGTGFTRADDPHLMLRNPALLADMWDDMALGSAHVLLIDACFHATGGYGRDYGSLPDVSDFGEGPRLATDPVNGYLDQPYPEVCYDGPTPVLPTFALTKKLAPNWGVGLGFFPPDTTQLSQYGNRDGTVETPKGSLQNPTRFFRSHLNTSYFTALGAVGYRPADWIRVGFGFQWTLVIFESTTWSRPAMDLAPRTDIRTDTYGKDLFIPGFIGSVQIVPSDNWDFALGFKWSDRLVADSKLDLTTGVFGTGKPVTINGEKYGSTVPTTLHNLKGDVDGPPIWVPQLSIGARYSDRLRPRTTTSNWNDTHLAAGREVLDHMATERWDVEAEAVVYLNSANDKQTFSTNPSSERLQLNDVQADGQTSSLVADAGECSQLDAQSRCIGKIKTPVVYGGKTQLSLRVGGDYNIVPGTIALRAGLSYETNGIYTEYLNIMNYMMGRTGLHAGFTFRVADKTDVTFAFAHFIQPEVRLQVNPASNFSRRYYLDAAGNFDPVVAKKYNYSPGTHDGIAKVEAPYGKQFGPNFINAGTFFYNLDVLSFSLAQHF